ncbi:glycoside hydrolase family 16 protein [Lepidopterella palustris CBS 459.81]|uniref:Glycoside hydrolase family 16 protein n=1 Tax=Lepidopterella palustris CBS 459.81 TaxID=1314670 RepID=A0A8E2E890_9PEZI|nr:glycoside hydrolase family 16 protein [Lepidopterella palustris CBS 459.81]
MISSAQALILGLILQPILAQNVTDLKDNSANCSCYVVETDNTPSYFQYHRFWDFRNVASAKSQYTVAPPAVNNSQGAGTEMTPDQEFLNSSAWNTDWGIQNWGKPSTSDFPIRMQNSPANVFILQNNSSSYASDYDTYLALRTTRLEDFQSSAEVENEQKNLMHASLRVKARVIGDPGAVAGFFTFYDDNNESDIEILTSDPKDMIRYTNQPSVDKNGNEIPQSSLNGTGLPAWDNWRTHRIDWLAKKSYWYIDGQEVANNTYSVPRKPSGLVINMWSDGGEWSGNMTIGGSAEYHIQWIELAFNTSGPVGGPGGGNRKRDEEEGILEKRKSKGCQVVCRVDGVKDVGFPEVAHVAASLAGMGAVPLVSSWALVVMMGLVSFLMGF